MTPYFVFIGSLSLDVLKDGCDDNVPSGDGAGAVFLRVCMPDGFGMQAPGGDEGRSYWPACISFIGSSIVAMISRVRMDEAARGP